jgi:hypothetical protein
MIAENPFESTDVLYKKVTAGGFLRRYLPRKIWGTIQRIANFSTLYETE